LPRTLTVTALEVAFALWSSVALAVKEYVPGGGFFQVRLYGAVVSDPIKDVPAKNSTFLTVPSLSVALAVMVIVVGAVNVAAFAGAVMLTAGGTLLVVAPRV
jgi:amino acid permease